VEDRGEGRLGAPRAGGSNTARPDDLLERGRCERDRLGRLEAHRSLGERSELYDVSRDPNETKNLASSRPAKVEELGKLLTERRSAIRDDFSASDTIS
jgi:hypothetical protein